MGQKSNVEVVVPTQFVLEGAMNKADTPVSNHGDRADSMGTKMDCEENIIFDEYDGVQESFDSKINQLYKNMNELKEYYQILNIENDNTDLLIDLIQDLRKRIEKLERKVACQ